MCVCVCVCVCVCGVCLCVCVCVSCNASGYLISHPWEELHLYVMGFICVHVL